MSNDKFDFWGGLIKSAYTDVEGVSDTVNMFLDEGVDKEASDRTIRELTDRSREEKSLSLPVEDGTRVRFVANLGTVLSMADAPENNATGTVVNVKSASGFVTSHEGRVFVKWDDGQFRTIHATHLRKLDKKTTTRTSHSVRVSSLGDLSDFLRIGTDTLIHKATKDIWSFTKDEEGYTITRLIGEDGKPLKV